MSTATRLTAATLCYPRLVSGVVFGGGDYLLLDVGFELTKPLAHEANPNALAKRDKKFEFKHSAPNGSKWWTSSLGVTFLFAIPKENIQIVADTCGYSYPKIVINEQTITLNTSGGTIDGGGWGDFVGDAASTLINLCREAFLAIAETGVVNDQAAIWRRIPWIITWTKQNLTTTIEVSSNAQIT